ncbi:MAG: thioesterase family protein [Bacteroidales bacterium]|nr:thioesterase family protein [Bacteroidales bacterium]
MYISETILAVRYYETDLMGIVHHSNYIRYFECGRSEALANLGLPIHKIEKLGIMMPVVNVSCDYKLPARLGDTLRVVSTVNEIPKARMVIDTVIYNQEGNTVCAGFVTLGFIHANNRRPTRAPSFIIDIFAQYFKEND